MPGFVRTLIGIPLLKNLINLIYMKGFRIFIMCFNIKEDTSYIKQLHNFSSVCVYMRPDAGVYLQPKHVAVNKLINNCVVCGYFVTCTYHSLCL
jgi:hypothetical protein